MDSSDGCVSVVSVNEYRNLDLGGADHADIDLSLIESLEHLRGYACVALHACAYDRDLSYVLVEENVARAVGDNIILESVYGSLTVALGYGEGDVLLVVLTDGLENDVYVDALLRKT